MTANREFSYQIKKPVVYIASPYTKGDPAINTRFQCEMFDAILNSGLCWPVAPLWSHFQHTLFPRKYTDWVEYDLAMIAKYDACVRLSATYSDDSLDYHEGTSSGADNEVKEFLKQGKPVFFTLVDLYRWASRQVEVATTQTSSH
jgi:hypothetical protein